MNSRVLYLETWRSYVTWDGTAEVITDGFPRRASNLARTVKVPIFETLLHLKMTRKREKEKYMKCNKSIEWFDVVS